MRSLEQLSAIPLSAVAVDRTRDPASSAPATVRTPEGPSMRLVRALNKWVRRAIADQKTLVAAGHELTVAVNMSGRLLSVCPSTASPRPASPFRWTTTVPGCRP